MSAVSSAGITKPPCVESESADHQILAEQSLGKSGNRPIPERAAVTRSLSARVPVSSASVLNLRSTSIVQTLWSNCRPEPLTEPRSFTLDGTRSRISEMSAGSVSVETTVSHASPD